MEPGSSRSTPHDKKFDALLRTPMKQNVCFKPLGHWAQKVAELEEKHEKSKKKGLFDLSSFEDTPPRRKKKKPKPRKKKENMNIVHSYAKKKKKSKVEIRSPHEGLKIKERILLNKYENMKDSVFTLEKDSVIFGLSSTPGKGHKKVNFVEPSKFDFCSPIPQEAAISPIALPPMLCLNIKSEEDKKLDLAPSEDDDIVDETFLPIKNEVSPTEEMNGVTSPSKFDFCSPIPQEAAISPIALSPMLCLNNKSEEDKKLDLAPSEDDDIVDETSLPIKKEVSPTEEMNGVTSPKNDVSVYKSPSSSFDITTPFLGFSYMANEILETTYIISTKDPVAETRGNVCEINRSTIFDMRNVTFRRGDCRKRIESTCLLNGISEEVSPYFQSEPKSTCESPSTGDGKDVTSRCGDTVESSIVVFQQPDSSCLHKIILKGGKHTRARSIFNQLQTEKMSNLEESVLSAPAKRGKGYQSFVENLIDMQTSMLSASTTTDCTVGRFVRPRPSMYKTSMYQVSVNEGRRSVLCEQPSFSMTRMPINRQSVLERSICVVPIAETDDTPFRQAYGVHPSTPCIDSASKEKLTPREVVLQRCHQKRPLGFSKIFNKRTLPNCSKIGEGVYGEVFMFDANTGRRVLKIIPIEGDLKVNDEPQKTFREILSEIVITMELSDLRKGDNNCTDGFTELSRVCCVVGKYPKFLTELWEDYDQRRGSDNDHPCMFGSKQLFIVFELPHGGIDLEAFVFENATQSAAAFKQIALSLAVAETALEFEHRDLHWGNILLQKTEYDTVSFVIDGKKHTIPTHGVKVTLIDFTLSRMRFEGCCIYNDLSVDSSLFESYGDYQFEIYRMMRSETRDNWESFAPKTNVFWLHYVVDKMLQMVRYSQPFGKIHEAGTKTLRLFREDCLSHKNSAEFSISFLP